MNHTRQTAAMAILTIAIGLGPGTAAHAQDITAVMRIEAAGEQPMEMDYYLGENRMRMDMSEEMSLISIGGDEPRMFMVQHPDQSYIEWGPQQLQMMQQMMQQMPGAADQYSSTFDPGNVQFQQTGETAQIGPWDAFEVEMTDPNGEVAALWLTTDSDIGLFEVMVRAASATSLMNSPMGGGGGPSMAFLQFQAFAQAQGLPEGRVVRIVSNDDNSETTISLVEAEPGPIPDETFTPPADYTPMQMPSIPGFPG